MDTFRMSDKLRSGYDRLAPWYQTIERLRFGNTLQRARVSMLSALCDSSNQLRKQGPLEVLFLGDGDGRLLAAFLEAFPNASVTSVDVSTKMVAFQKRRLERLGMDDRVHWIVDSVMSVELPSARFDIVITSFFLDCFDEREMSQVVSRVATWGCPQAIWYLVDFHEPDQGMRRIWAQSWLFLMHIFFRWQTGLSTQRIVDPRPLLESMGFQERMEQRLHFDMIRAILFRRV